MSFASPLWLLALLVVPAALLAQWLARRRAGRYAVRFTAVAAVREALPATSWRRHLPVVALLLAAAAIAAVLARPQVASSVTIRQASLVLVLDHSGSMQAGDVAPTRLTAAERAANSFVDVLPSGIRVGVVTFSSAVDSVLAPTTNRAAVRRAIASQTANGATATGDALEIAMRLLTQGGTRRGRAAIVLLSDGAANAGPDPVAVASLASRHDISIDTVALGTPGGVLLTPGPFGSQQTPVPPDPQLMQAIARASHGRTFSAQDSDRLNSIYKNLGTTLSSRATKRDVTAAFAGAALALLLLAGLAATRWSPRLP